jgi:hypothetical protein
MFGPFYKGFSWLESEKCSICVWKVGFSSLTDKSKILKEHVLRQHAGWSVDSQMPQRYIHYLGNEESNENLLEVYGIMPKGQQIDRLKPKQCPNCFELNKPESKFCVKCRMILSYDAYSETLEKQKEEKNQWDLPSGCCREGKVPHYEIKDHILH